MATFSQRKKQSGWKLDVDDMERRIVEFRVQLDREKRRCEQAHMTDNFRELLTAKLMELDSSPRPADTKSIEVQKLESEDFSRLNNFLLGTISLCSRKEQYENYETILREVLKLSRRKSVEASAATRREPFCFFCAGNLDGSTNNPPPAQIEHEPLYPIFEQVAAQFTNIDTARAPIGDATPPPSAAPTPEVGEQARQQAPTGQPRDQPRDQQRGPEGEQAANNIWQEQPSLEQFQPQFRQSFTTDFAPQTTYTPYIPSVDNINRCSLSANGLTISTTPPMSPAPSNSQQVNSTTSQPLTQQVPATKTNASNQQLEQPQSQQQQQQQQQNHRHQQPPQEPYEPQPGPSGLGNRVVHPSDSSDSDSDDDSDSESHDEVRTICKNLTAYELPNGDKGRFRSSTPLGDKMHQSQGRLVIDESGPSPVKRRRKIKPGSNRSLGASQRTSTNGTKPVPMQVQVPEPVPEPVQEPEPMQEPMPQDPTVAATSSIGAEQNMTRPNVLAVKKRTKRRQHSRRT